MKKIKFIFLAAIIFSFIFIACNQNTTQNSNDSFEKQLQEKLINAKKGEVIEIPEGKFEISRTLSLDAVPFITIRGVSPSQTVLSFKNQTEGAEGLKITNANDFVIENLSIHDTKGDGLKIQDSRNVTIKNVAVGWTDGAKSSNGSYGIYPVTCKKVLIEKCAVTAASDAGIYVGQSENIIIRNNVTYENVAGIEIENCVYADVYNNKSYNNTGGIFIFDLPELPKKNGHHIRIFNNVIKNNNFPNFSPEGNTVAMVPAGTGTFVMSAREVEIFKNEITGHKTVSVAVISYLLTQKPYKDSLYNPFSSAVHIHDNKIEQQRSMPDTTRQMGKLIAMLFQSSAPEIIYDGFADPAFVEKNGKIREAGKLCIRNNGEIKFANINAPSNFKQIKTDLKEHDCEQGELAAVEL